MPPSSPSPWWRAAQVVCVAHTFVSVWERVSALLAELDVLAGFADLAAHAPAPYVRPTLLPARPRAAAGSHPRVAAAAARGEAPEKRQRTGEAARAAAGVGAGAGAGAEGEGGPEEEAEVLELVGCRHPCVEAQEGVEFISNDCVMKKVGGS